MVQQALLQGKKKYADVCLCVTSGIWQQPAVSAGKALICTSFWANFSYDP